MRRTMIRMLAAVAMLAVLGSTGPASAGSVIATRYYEAANGLLFDSNPDPTCSGSTRPCPLSKDGTIDVGGVEFAAIGGTGTTQVVFEIFDDHNTSNSPAVGRVSYTACQDLNDNNICGESAENEPSVSGCTGSATPRVLTVRKNVPVTVFVRALWGCPTYLVPDVAERQGVATSGRVVMRYFP